MKKEKNQVVGEYLDAHIKVLEGGKHPSYIHKASAAVQRAIQTGKIRVPTRVLEGYSNPNIKFESPSPPYLKPVDAAKRFVEQESLANGVPFLMIAGAIPEDHWDHAQMVKIARVLDSHQIGHLYQNYFPGSEDIYLKEAMNNKGRLHPDTIKAYEDWRSAIVRASQSKSINPQLHYLDMLVGNLLIHHERIHPRK